MLLGIYSNIVSFQIWKNALPFCFESSGLDILGGEEERKKRCNMRKEKNTNEISIWFCRGIKAIEKKVTYENSCLSRDSYFMTEAVFWKSAPLLFNRYFQLNPCERICSVHTDWKKMKFFCSDFWKLLSILIFWGYKSVSNKTVVYQKNLMLTFDSLEHSLQVSSFSPILVARI